MASITLKGNPISTIGDLPAVGSQAPDFSFVRNDLSEGTLYGETAQFKVLNIFPSVDTGTCALSVKQFNERAAALPDTKVLCVSKDLPFAQKRFCGAEGIDKVDTVSVFRSDFADSFQVKIADGPLSGLCARAIVVLDADNKVIYTEQVAETTEEPNYDTAINSFK